MPQFALAHLLALTNIGIQDYHPAKGSNIYKQAVKPLKDEFDCSSSRLNLLLAQLKDHAITYRGTCIMSIPLDLNDPDMTIDMISGYGWLTLVQVHAHAATYVNQQSYLAQDSLQMYSCLMSTLTTKGKN